MPYVRPVEDEFLDELIATAERAFARAALRSFNTAAGAIRMAVVASAGESVVSLDDAALAAQSWKDQIPELIASIKASFEASAYGVVNGIGEAVLPAAAQAGLTIPPIVDTAALDHLAMASNRITKFGDQMWGAVRQELLTGFQSGESIEELSRRVSRAGKITEARARTIARTEIISASNAGAHTAAQAMPNSLKPRLKEWLASGDSRTRESHSAADGQQVPLDKKFSVGGASLRYPGDPQGPADEIVNCRCTVLMDVDPVHTTCAIGSLTAAGDPAVPPYRDARLASGLSRKEMSQKLGMSVYQLDLIELGKKAPTDQEHAKFMLVPEYRKHFNVAALTPSKAIKPPQALPGADVIGSCTVSKHSKPTAPTEPMTRTGDRRTFISHDDGVAYGKTLASKWQKTLTPDEREGFKFYTGPFYQNMNQSLRGNLSDFLKESTTPAGAERVRGHMRATTQALHRNSLPEPIETVRIARFPKGTFKEGAIFRDEGYVSTSLGSDSPNVYANPDGKTIRFRMQIPEGTKGSYIGGVSGYKHKEAEFLLPPGANFKVIKVEKDVNGVDEVTVALIQQDTLEEALIRIERTYR